MFAAAKKMILRSSGRPSRSRASSLVARLEDVDVDARRDVVHGKTVQQRARRDDVGHPARRHDEVQAGALVDAVLEAVEERSPVVAQARVLAEVRAHPAAVTPPLAVERVRDVPGQPPLVVQLPHHWSQARDRRQRSEAEVRAVQVVQLHDRRGAEPRVREHTERRRVEDVLEAEQVEELARRAVERAPEQVSFQRADVGVRCHLPPDEHARDVPEAVEAAVQLVRSAACAARRVRFADVQDVERRHSGLVWRAAPVLPRTTHRPERDSALRARRRLRGELRRPVEPLAARPARFRHREAALTRAALRGNALARGPHRPESARARLRRGTLHGGAAGRGRGGLGGGRVVGRRRRARQPRRGTNDSSSRRPISSTCRSRKAHSTACSASASFSTRPTRAAPS